MLNDVVITEETDDDDDEEVEVVRMVEDEDYNEVHFLFQSRKKIHCAFIFSIVPFFPAAKIYLYQF